MAPTATCACCVSGASGLFGNHDACNVVAIMGHAEVHLYVSACLCARYGAMECQDRLLGLGVDEDVALAGS